jgi:hypothetical protein
MNSYTLSLSRWHKVAERLAKTYTEYTTSAKIKLTQTQVTGYYGEAQVARLREEGIKAREDIKFAFVVQDCLVKLRKAIGEANARTGVGTELAEYDALCRRHKLLETLLIVPAVEMVELDDLPQLPKEIVVENRYDNNRGSVRVNMMDSQIFAELLNDEAILSSRVYALADKISDMNRERLTVELPEEIARIAGL